MHKPDSGNKHHCIHFIEFLLAACLIVGCTKTTPTPAGLAAEEINPTIFPAVSATSLPLLPSATTAPTLLPTAGTPAPSEQSGVIVFSMGDGQYKHLFAYHPSYLPITRLTADPWDFDFPAISPDGSKIAYCANQYGRWDIFILDLILNQVEQVTQTETYNCAPTWSPDGQWLAFEKYSNGNFDIIIYPVSDKSISPIQLTQDGGNNYSPSWSPTGRQIAFVTDRNSRSEIWLARLDDPENRFTTLATSNGNDYSSPRWSPDGTSLAWNKSGEQPVIEILRMTDEGNSITSLGIGEKPVWIPDGSGLLTLLTFPNQYNFTAYEAATSRLMLPPIPLPSQVSNYDWKAADLANNLAAYVTNLSLPEPANLWQPKITLPNPQTGRNGLVILPGVNAPEPYLSDAVNESFQSLRTALTAELGWDYLRTLENAAISLTTSPQPGIEENWLYTGRAIAVNQLPLEAGWMAATREDFNGRTYWRIWLKCYQQDGTCGEPLRGQIWDFSARYSKDKNARENGGKLANPPEGYWIDFTGYASRYGWQRIPSESDWRSYFPGIQLNIFVLRESLSWKDAMLQLYPPETVESILEPDL